MPQSICPESFTLLAFLCMQEYREKKMDKNGCQETIDQHFSLPPINIQMVAMDI